MRLREGAAPGDDGQRGPAGLPRRLLDGVGTGAVGAVEEKSRTPRSAISSTAASTSAARRSP
ncbi:MAG TPA: hypothetical protein VN969_37990 [Streptosporangiaceae bacterium]|nr:hypothetical protein [Streptosporangiaceae bacterium]